MRFLSLALLSLLIVACERQPAAPDQVIGPQFQATRSEVTNTVDLVDDPADCTANPRIGEILLFTGRITFVQRTTSSGSGNANTTAFAIYDPSVHLVGQTSGTVWMIDAGRTSSVLHDNIHGAGESLEGIADEYYTNGSGAQLNLHGNVHLTINADGSIAVDRPLAWVCIGG